MNVFFLQQFPVQLYISERKKKNKVLRFSDGQHFDVLSTCDLINNDHFHHFWPWWHWRCWWVHSNSLCTWVHHHPSLSPHFLTTLLLCHHHHGQDKISRDSSDGTGQDAKSDTEYFQFKHFFQESFLYIDSDLNEDTQFKWIG